MEPKQARVERHKIYVREAEAKVRQTKCDMENGYKRLQIELEEKYSKLKNDFEKAQLELETSKVDLLEATRDLERGFEVNDGR